MGLEDKLAAAPAMIDPTPLDMGVDPLNLNQDILGIVDDQLEVLVAENRGVLDDEKLGAARRALDARGLGDLATTMVEGHGERMSMVDAVALCGRSVLGSLDTQVGMYKMMGGTKENLLPTMAKAMDRLGANAKASQLDRQPAGAEKK